MQLLQKYREYYQSQFVKNLFTLTSGTAIAQLIPIIASPFLSRLFTPAEFGIFANFLSITSILMVFYSGKFEYAIVLPERHEEAINIVGLTILLSLISTILVSLLFLFTGSYLGELLKYDRVTAWLWLTPISALLANIYFIFNEWCIRKNNYLVLSKNKITNTSSITLSSLVFGVAKIRKGLIWGQILGQVATVFFAIKRFVIDDFYLLKFISLRKIKYFAGRYIEFFKFYMPGQLVNTVSGQLPVFLFTMQFGIFKVGLFSLADRVFGVAMSFIGTAIRDVYKQKAAVEFREKGHCYGVFKNVALLLSVVSAVIFSILFFASPFLFPLVFGKEWTEAGQIARILCIMYMFGFISVPLSYTLIIAERQRYEFIWQISFFLFTFIPLLIGIKANDFRLSLILLAGGRCLSYVFQFVLSLIIARGKTA